jgi:hypothetical protein
MKRFLFISFIVLALTHCALYADMHCLDNSRHMEVVYDDNGNRITPYDDKAYRHVYCNCPCGKRYKISPDRGRCMMCLHYRVPQPLTIQWPKNSPHHSASAAAAADKVRKKKAIKKKVY